MDVFRVRLNCIDHYQATPTKYDPRLRSDVPFFDLRKEPKVPVVRIFGSTETGQKVCAHIHGAFPYLYVEYDGSLHPDHVAAYIYRLHLSIDHALAVSYRRNVYDGNSKYVAAITLVKAVPFYGFYVGYRFYLKIYMLNPMVMTRLSELLLQGIIMKRKFQPYEAHLQYLLQFMTDYNLYGCGYVEARRISFRAPVPKREDDEESPHLWHSQSVPMSYITDDADLPRVSHCSIEVDICVQDILNRNEVRERRLHHDFVERKNPLPSDMKLVQSMAGLWRDETMRRKRRMMMSNPGSSPFPSEALVSMSADPRNSQIPGWIHEEEYRENVKALIRLEDAQGDQNHPTFDTFVQSSSLENTVQTMLQSVEDFYPDNLASTLHVTDGVSEEVEDPASSILVDEGRILDIDGDEDGLFPDDSDEENLRAEQARKRAAPESKVSSDPGSEGTKASKGPVPNLATRLARSQQTTVDGSVSVSESNASATLPNGVMLSCLRTGKVPRIPVSKHLLHAAEEQGLVSKSPRDAPRTHRGEPFLKRSISPPPKEEQPKRRRVEFALDVGRDAINDSAPAVPDTLGSPNSTEAQPALSRNPSPLSSSEPSKKLKNQTLKFPVVKDPNNPETRLRLSQQSSSQKSDDGQAKSQVFFEPTTPTSKPSSHISPVSTKIDTTSLSASTASTVKGGHSQKVIDVGCPSRPRAQFFVFGESPPSTEEVLSTMQSFGVPDMIYQDAYYSNHKDVPNRVREYAGQEFRLEGNTIPYLPDFDPTGSSPATFGIKSELAPEARKDNQVYQERRQQCTLKSWEIGEPPPTFDEVQAWWNESQELANGVAKSGLGSGGDVKRKPYLSQIDGPTPRNKHGFKYSQKKKSTSVQHEAQYMSTMSLEIHVNTRGKLVPNPEEDEIQCIFWCSKSDEHFATSDQASVTVQSGIIVLSEDGSLARKIQKQTSVEVYEEPTELDVLTRMVDIVRIHDPDILTGYEVHGSSWGFLIERARFKYDYSLCDEFSRMKSQSFGRFGKEADRWGFNTTSTIRVTGRHMINIWRAMRGELNLLQYTMENVVWHLLHRRIPHYAWHTLTEWFTSGKPRDLSKLLRYYLTRTKLDIEILEANELIPRTSEQARLLGVDFFSVFSRGSQFKVESIMFRIAKPENFILVSPDRKQVGSQNALECLPLVMEPQSAFYNSPVLVLDFQSLYPSVMIAYNYCYSTFLGRIVNWRGKSKMGFTDYQRQEKLLSLLRDYINIAPNGIMYCKPEIRKSLLAKMLTEILETRLMVKSGMKQDKEDKTLQQLLNNRQLALKLLANVTYGYTSASFSGRMPCSEIADSIVQTGRETLEKAIALIHSVNRWGAEVVYGDTDSLFVHLPGRTRDQAFDIGEEIAQVVTDMNPRPIKLKFEKVYHPCVLLAKKRYVGHKYESRAQAAPEFDAKGIETVRRDGTPAEQKIEEKALRLLFDTADLSRVKAYFQRQCDKIMRGAVSVQDFCFAREVKLGTYSNHNGAPPPPGALVSARRMRADARAEPQYGERVPYVVVSGAPGARLADRCVAPEELLDPLNSHLALDADYYIARHLIPPLERIFNLVGANVRAWYDEMPRVQRVRRVGGGEGAGGRSATAAAKRATLESYMKTATCLLCSAKLSNPSTKSRSTTTTTTDLHLDLDLPLCARCLSPATAPTSLATLQTRLAASERGLRDVEAVCRSCAGLAPGGGGGEDPHACDSKDCPVFYTRVKLRARCAAADADVGVAVRGIVEVLRRREERALLEW